MYAKMKTLLAAMAVLAMMCGTAAAEMPAPKPAYYSIATSSAGGTLFSLAGVFAAVVKNKFPQLKMNGEITGGVYDNINLLKNNKVEFAFCHGQPVYEAYNGIGKFSSGKITNFTALGSGQPEIWHLYTLKSTNIRTMADLKGKRISLGATGSAGNAVGKEVMEAHGLIMNKDWTPEYISHGDGPDALRDGRVDAVVLISVAPTGAVTDITSSYGADAVFILPEPEVLEKLFKKHPYWARAEIPAGVYNGYDKAVPGTFGMPIMMLARNDVPKETAYWIIRTIYENHETVARSIDLGRYWTPNKERALDPLNGVVPLHPGAEAYFREIGELK